MWRYIKGILAGQNQFASGGMILMIIGGLSVYLRAVPETLWYWLVGQTTMMITVKDDDVAFVWVKEWFLEQKFLKRVRRVDLDTTMRGERVALIPAPGRHWFWYRGRPFLVWFYRSEETRERISRRVEELTFRTSEDGDSSCSDWLTMLCHAISGDWECSRFCTRTTTDGTWLKGTRRGCWSP